MHGDYDNWAERRPVCLRGGRTTHLMLLQVLFPKGKQPQRMMIGEGFGFFISADGYIVTNNHVAAHAQSVQITTDAAATQDVVPDIFDTC